MQGNAELPSFFFPKRRRYSWRGLRSGASCTLSGKHAAANIEDSPSKSRSQHVYLQPASYPKTFNSMSVSPAAASTSPRRSCRCRTACRCLALPRSVPALDFGFMHTHTHTQTRATCFEIETRSSGLGRCTTRRVRDCRAAHELGQAQPSREAQKMIQSFGFGAKRLASSRLKAFVRIAGCLLSKAAALGSRLRQGSGSAWGWSSPGA